MARTHLRRILEEKTVVSCLEQTLKAHGISKYFYNLGGYGEDKICLERHGHNRWALFYGCHGQKTNKAVYTDILEASRNIINQLADDEDAARQMICQFDREINRKFKSQGIPRSTIPAVNVAPAIATVRTGKRTVLAKGPAVTEVGASIAAPAVIGASAVIAALSRHPGGTKSLK